MQKNYVIGFPRIGEQRELKHALENFWSRKNSFEEVVKTAHTLKQRHWNYQKNAGIDCIASNDFSLYDNMLDTSIMLGAIPKRFQGLTDEELYFTMARGDAVRTAMEMTKWFNTNYHYIVPELAKEDTYTLNAEKIVREYKEAKANGVQTKINIIGPLTYLGLAKRQDGGDTFEFLEKILPVYEALIQTVSQLDNALILQIEEPIFVHKTDTAFLSLIKPVYDRLTRVSTNTKIALITYFEHACEAVKILIHTPIWAIGLDFLYGSKNMEVVADIAKSGKKLIAGVIDGRNIWKTDIENTLVLLENIATKIPKENILVSTSCSLLHVPFTLRYETVMDTDVKNWLSYACEKLGETALVTKLFFNETLSQEEKQLLAQNKAANQERKKSALIHDTQVQNRSQTLEQMQRKGSYQERIKLQKESLAYPTLATTTIGSFPQTQEVRNARRDLKRSHISQAEYERKMRNYIDECIAFQETCGLDVLVHGEPERNDMVEYFGERLKGFGFSQNGWVQSYGSRCVKPPFIYGDVSRPRPMSVEWITYAQNKTQKIVKGMLTGPVTILNWSFVRDDMPRSEVSKQIALAVNDEVNDLQKAGIKIIQVDEAAFKEGYPLRKENVRAYETWAVRDFKLSVSSAYKHTQIHTHMCYSEFNDIIQTIEAMDADVISIETARSGNKLLKVFQEAGYKQEIGPGIYDIHSPRIPSVQEMKKQIKALLELLPKEQLWINPDCGLKTRKYEEVEPSLRNMVQATREVRQDL